ncbi:MAG: hypothetical protein HRT88_00675 [Lentisphaeraceae bacterium]|nr:hypothetical protein [Lentisphaeraceae bacterium]
MLLSCEAAQVWNGTKAKNWWSDFERPQEKNTNIENCSTLTLTRAMNVK